MGRENWHERYKKVEPILEKKRFHLSKEPALQERVHALQAEFEKFKSEHPEVVDFTFYGSLSKGYAAESSDIDGMLDDAIKYFVE